MYAGRAGSFPAAPAIIPIGDLVSTRTVIVVGAGMGGLAAAIRLARRGFRVRLLEARPVTGGLAAGFEQDGLPFDAGPYILLDRPGLTWAFAALGLDLAEHVSLRRIQDVYEVASPGTPPVRIRASAEQTADGLEREWPGSGARYRAFVGRAWTAYRRLQPLLTGPRPGPLALLRGGAWRSAGFALRPLAAHLSRSGLPGPVVDALGIWTHVAAQRLETAPGVLAFVPALIHEVGAYYAEGGVGAVPRALESAAVAAGVEIERGVGVRRLLADGARVTGVETADGRAHQAAAVVSGAGGLKTYLDLGLPTPGAAAGELRTWPLQSPGVCAYLAARGDGGGPYLRFSLPGAGETCRLLIRPALLDSSVAREGWAPARLLSPMDHGQAEATGRAGQDAYLDRVLAEGWWREGLAEARVVRRRLPVDWGAEYGLYRDSMNPVMTSRLMRAGRLAHRSPHFRGLYLAGSATHPGQWVSFCAISGVLAADALAQDLG
jgi:phytoene dehydrogenase-like protein